MKWRGRGAWQYVQSVLNWNSYKPRSSIASFWLDEYARACEHCSRTACQLTILHTHPSSKNGHLDASVIRVSIGSDNGLPPNRPQAIIWTNTGSLSIGPSGTNCSELLFRIQHFSFKKMHLIISAKMASILSRGRLKRILSPCRSPDVSGDTLMWIAESGSEAI